MPISQPFTTALTDLQRVFLGREEPLIGPPTLDEGEAAGLAGGVGQGVHHILKRRERERRVETKSFIK